MRTCENSEGSQPKRLQGVMVVGMPPCYQNQVLQQLSCPQQTGSRTVGKNPYRPATSAVTGASVNQKISRTVWILDREPDGTEKSVPSGYISSYVGSRVRLL